MVDTGYHPNVITESSKLSDSEKNGVWSTSFFLGSPGNGIYFQRK